MPELASRALSYGNFISDEEITSLSTAQALTVPAGTVSALITARGQAIRYRYAGTPTATAGHFVAANGSVEIFGGNQLANLKIIEVTASAAVFISYFGN